MFVDDNRNLLEHAHDFQRDQKLTVVQLQAVDAARLPRHRHRLRLQVRLQSHVPGLQRVGLGLI